MLGLAAVWMGLRWRLSAVERRAARLEALVDQRTVQLVEARDAAESASRAKSEFVAGISHELRHPLQSILGHAERLQGNATLPQSERDRGAVIEASGRRLLRLIDDVLDVARLDAGRLSVRPAVCDLAGLVDRMEATHAPLAASRGLRWRVRRAGFGEDTLTVNIDAERVGQIVDNLVSNALKFSRSGEVGLRVTVQADGVAFAVRDEGPGIAAEEQARIFEAFEQGGAGRQSGKGLRLRLGISRGLATLMGGTLTVASALGRGGCFTLWLPLVVGGRSEIATPVGMELEREERELITALRRAAGCGDVARLRELLRRLCERPAWEPAAAEIERLLERFQLAGVRRMLDQIETESG